MGRKKQRLRVRHPVIREFPQDDGYWWIRWVDGYHDTHPTLPQPKVGVHLERLDVPLRHVIRKETGEATLAMKRFQIPSSDQVTVRVSIGNITDLVIGSTYHNGRRAGMMGVGEEGFEFDLLQSPPRLIRFYDTCLEPPDWWDPQYVHRVVNRKEYRIPREDSWGVMLTTPDASLVLLIPCHEVFRFFYAKQSKMASALLSGPWEVTRDQIVNPARTFIREDGDWQIVLRNGMREDSMYHAANLVLHPEGLIAAKRIYSAMMEDGSPWHVRADIPYAPHRLRIRAKILPLLDYGYKRLLCTQLLSVHWPHPNPVHFIRENDPTAGKREHETDNSIPFEGHTIELSGLDEYHVENTSWEDPTFKGPTITHPAPGSGLIGLPPTRKMTKDESFRYRRPNWDPDQEPADSTSARDPSHGNSCVTVGSFDAIGDPREHLVERFAKVLELFEYLKNCEFLQDWQTLPPAGGPSRYFLEGEPVWPLPLYVRNEKGVRRKRPWAIVDKSTGRPRCTLISRLTLIGGSPIYWLDIEPSIPQDQDTNDQEDHGLRRARGFRSLILSAGHDPGEIEPILKAALALCVRCRGIWPDPREIIRFTGAGAANCWIHHHLRTGELSINSACKAIEELGSLP